jgi:hypothetical protein
MTRSTKILHLPLSSRRTGVVNGDGEGHGHMRSDTDVLAPLDVFDQHHSRSQRQHLRVVQPHRPKSAQGLILPATPISRRDSLLARVFTNGGMSMTSSSDHDDERANECPSRRCASANDHRRAGRARFPVRRTSQLAGT